MAILALPLIKALAPYIAQIATAAIPAFTSKSKSESAKTDPVIAKQIEELQAAATQNAQSIHTLAEKLQQAIQGIETAAQEANKKVLAYKTILFISLTLSALSMLTCVYILSKA
jgi:hypothetical protein